MAERPVAGRAGSRLIELDELEISIEKLVAGGEGLGRFEGIPIFVPRAAPGDRLRVQLVQRRPDYGRAEILEILTPGPARRPAPCTYYDRCGGCDLQHLTEDAQLRLKVEAARETLMRLGGIAVPAKVTVVAGKPWGYRLRHQLQIAETTRGVEIGYFARGSHDLVAIDHCPILQTELEKMLPRLPRLLRDQPHQRLDVTVGDDGQITTAPVTAELPHREVSITLGGLEYAYDARCFFQAHRQLLPTLIEHVIGEWTGATAIDLYAGVGLFSLPLARRYSKVVAVESDGVAARFGRTNARRNRLPQVRYEAQSVETWIARLPASADRVVVDPPRKGLTLSVRQALMKKLPERLTYVSCNVATLARDLKQIQRAYQLDSLALLDMFPQTGHLEAVAQLSHQHPS